MKVDKNGRQVSFKSANVVGTRGWFDSGRILDQFDLGVTTLQNDEFRVGSRDLGKPQGVATKTQAFIEIRNVD